MKIIQLWTCRQQPQPQPPNPKGKGGEGQDNTSSHEITKNYTAYESKAKKNENLTSWSDIKDWH